ncbi:MAG TPA: flagellar FlbD family protein [Thermomicrobiales bacterium]|nr:flagellar FlbD family protein [Thermomicrobiales bacterium]
MIELTRLDGSAVFLNAELIETVEETPTTVITLTSHKRLTVKEPAAVVAERVIAYRRQIARGPLTLVTNAREQAEPAPPLPLHRDS